MSLLFGDRAVLDSLGNYKQLAWTQFDVAISELNGEFPLKDQEEVVRVVVLVPSEGSLDLDHHEINWLAMSLHRP